MNTWFKVVYNILVVGLYVAAIITLVKMVINGGVI